MKPYKAKNGAVQFMPSLSDVEQIIRRENTTGFCLACGSEQDGTEPDARKYTCHACGMRKVYGAEELLLMGLVHA